MDTDTIDTEAEEGLAQKIIKLLNQAERTTFAEEAESFTAKAVKLMMKHSIDQAVIEARRKGLGKPEEIVEKRIFVDGIYQPAWLELAFAVGGKGFGCRLMQNTSAYRRNDKGKPAKGSEAIWIGYESDVAQGEVLMASLLIQASTAMKEAWGTYKKEHPWTDGSDGFKWRRSFLFGFAQEVGNRLFAQRAAAETTAKAADTATDGEPGVGLVLVSRAKRLHDHYDQTYGRHSRSAPRRSYAGGGYSATSAGRAAGASANLGGKSVGSQRAIGR